MAMNNESLGGWDFVYGFIRDWMGVGYVPRAVGIEEEIGLKEKSLGVALPASVREWLAFGKSSKQLAGHFEFRDGLPAVEYLEELKAYSILLQAEGDLHWAIREADMGQEDPPVYAHYLNYDVTPCAFSEGVLFAASVSALALDYMLTYMSFAGGAFTVRRSVAGASLAELSNALGAVKRFGHLEIIRARDVVAFGSELRRNWHHDCVTVGFRTRGAFKAAPAHVQKLRGSAFVQMMPK